MRHALIALLLLGCGPAPELDAGLADSATSDAGLAWAQDGCEPIVECVRPDGLVPYCGSVHEHYAIIAADGGDTLNKVDRCQHWMRCPRADDPPCYACRDWSSERDFVAPPEGDLAAVPACTVDLCPLPVADITDSGVDAGMVRSCPDGG